MNRRFPRPGFAGGQSGPGQRGGRGRGFRISPSTKRSLIAAAVIVALILAVVSTATFWVNWWWFGDVGYRSMLTTRYLSRGLAFLVGAVLAGGFVLANLVFALRRSRGRRSAGDLPAIGERLFLLLLFGLSGFVALVVGSGTAARWQDWLLFLNREPFGVEDPVFGRDVGFYVFSLPVLQAVRTAATSVVFLTLLGTAVVYVLRLGINPRNYRRVPDLMRRHVFALAALLALLVAVRFYLANFELVYSERGAVFGAGYTDVTVQRFANLVLVALSVLAAAVLALNAVQNRLRPLLGVAVAWAVVLLLGAVIPAGFQRTVVEPNELRREQEFIANNIAMTREAHDLAGIEEREIAGAAPLAANDLAGEPATIDNIRLLDYRYALDTYQQNQSLRPYYAFTDVDVDRYVVDGDYRQVVISARELNVAGLPSNAQTWTNRHLAYTHGYGVVASPAGQVSAEGTPLYLVNSIPPSGTDTLALERPEIYFGERPSEWVILGTDTVEFTGLDQEAPPYAGDARGSIDLGSFAGRLISATFLRDRNVFISGELTDQSRLLIRRGVVERAELIAPFLSFDPDPYIVVADGRLSWVLDAYTATDRYPHATRARGVNYARNSVKVVVDAYDGTTTFYRTATPDPLADAWGEVYPDLFTPVDQVPPAIAAHFRYPQLLFDIQAEILTAHHVTEPRAFYNGNDRWAIPAGGPEGGEPLEPYYVTMTLPGEENADFTLILPYIPGGQQNRQNMTAWMAARTDGEGGPRLVVYRFPGQTSVLGPQQVEAQIDQDAEIAPQLTLLSQSGSEVLRGNLLVIPIDETVLYVQPLYVRATGSAGAFAQLQRVIVAANGRVVMRPTLDEALEAIVAGASDVPADTTAPPAGTTAPPAESGPPAPPSASTAPDQQALAQQALAAYGRAQAALATGDFAAYGAELAAMEGYLQQLAAVPASPVPAATPVATPAP